MTLVAIHQPNFFPWLGYFDKIVRSDLFIFMDNAQFPKKGGNWVNRVKLLVGGGGHWATVPVNRAYHGVLPISAMKIDNRTPWRDKLLKTIEMNYKSSPCYGEVFPVILPLAENPTPSLAEYNIASITALAKHLGLNTGKLILGSSLTTQGQSTDLLISMVRACGGTAYLCGGGAAYQDDEKFPVAGLQLIYQNFTHPQYPQASSTEFVPGLSIIDALMNCGFSGVRRLLGL